MIDDPLAALFRPRSVAVIGATERQGSVGRSVFWNLISSGFAGRVVPVNSHREAILGHQAYPTIASVPAPIDLAVIVTQAPTVPQIVADCAACGVGVAIVIAAGFSEAGAAGTALAADVRAIVARSRMRVLGPNCLGIMVPGIGLNASFASAMAKPGRVGFVSQSGALCTAILDWSLTENVGFSAFVSVGSMLDIEWGDVIDYLGDDPATKSIVMYVESVENARAFVSAAREVALTKPIIVIKAGRTAAAAKAAASHTGALTGSDAVFDAAAERSGILRVATISELFYMADVLANQPLPRGNRLAIVTNGGGPGILATDELIAGGGRIAALSPAAFAALDGALPAAWSRANPVDVLGDADPARYAGAVQTVLDDDENDAVLAIVAPQAVSAPASIADRTKSLATHGKPLFASWMGGAEAASGAGTLRRAGIPTFAYPDTAARVFNALVRYKENLRTLYETPALHTDVVPDRATIAHLLEAALGEGRTLLSEVESKSLLRAYGLPALRTEFARDAGDAVRRADDIGYPVVVKLSSHAIAHKADVGGVRLGLRDADAVRAAFAAIESATKANGPPGAFEGVSVQPMVSGDGYELILGSSCDAQFGPVVLFGMGGTLVEVFKDHAIALPPLTMSLAHRMIARTRISAAFAGIRGRPAIDVDRIADIVVRFASLVTEVRRIAEVDINPLYVSPREIVVLDARVVLHPRSVADDALPRSVIRPYPVAYAVPWQAKDGVRLDIRPIKPEDEPLLRAFNATLSERSVYLRFAHYLRLSTRIDHERLARLCYVDYDRQMALVAIASVDGQPAIVGVGRLLRDPRRDEAEFALLVSDAFQGRGLGAELLRRLVAVGRAEGVGRIVGYILAENDRMLRITRDLGFTLAQTPGDPLRIATLDVRSA